MTLKNMLVAFAMGSMALMSAGAAPGFAQESHIGNLTGHADSGKQLYRRYCIGCHGPDGDSNGENAPWIDPKPRDFTADRNIADRSGSLQRGGAWLRDHEHAVLEAADAATTCGSGRFY